MTKVIELYGGPHTGKSETCALIYTVLKKKERRVEMCREYAKDLSYRGELSTLTNQFLITSEQYKRMFDLVYAKPSPLEYIVSDCPVPLGIIYGYVNNMPYANELDMVINKVYQELPIQPINVRLHRDPTRNFDQHGRIHDLEESKEIDRHIDEYGIKFDVHIHSEDELNNFIKSL